MNTTSDNACSQSLHEWVLSQWCSPCLILKLSISASTKSRLTRLHTCFTSCLVLYSTPFHAVYQNQPLWMLFICHTISSYHYSVLKYISTDQISVLIVFWPTVNEYWSACADHVHACHCCSETVSYWPLKSQGTVFKFSYHNEMLVEC